MQPTRKQEVVWFKLRTPDPHLYSVPGCLRDLKLHRALSLVLHDDGAGRHLIAVAHVPYLEGDEIASTQLAVDAKVEERQFAHPATASRYSTVRSHPRALGPVSYTHLTLPTILLV